MEQKISISLIREIFQAADVEKLPELMKEYEQDSRSGVQALLSAARRKTEALEREKERIRQMRQYEREYSSCMYICGIDEVGRGPLAGPVVAGAVILPKDCEILYVNDSKQLSEKRREELYDVIMGQAVSVGTGCIP
ncbi:MAG: ribonuclease HII, partial [Lachnospiraceae bacterium]|nr:ribonuclease HII [Lachnospiraceae bacterium]